MRKAGNTYRGRTINPYRPVTHPVTETVQAHDPPATLTLLSFTNKFLKSSAVFGASPVAVKPAMVILVCYLEVPERGMVVVGGMPAPQRPD